jgi:hypothetical protein
MLAQTRTYLPGSQSAQYADFPKPRTKSETIALAIAGVILLIAIGIIALRIMRRTSD